MKKMPSYPKSYFFAFYPSGFCFPLNHCRCVPPYLMYKEFDFMFRGVCLHLIKQNFSELLGALFPFSKYRYRIFYPIAPKIPKILEILTLFPLNYDL